MSGTFWSRSNTPRWILQRRQRPFSFYRVKTIQKTKTYQPAVPVALSSVREFPNCKVNFRGQHEIGGVGGEPLQVVSLVRRRQCLLFRLVCGLVASIRLTVDPSWIHRFLFRVGHQLQSRSDSLLQQTHKSIDVDIHVNGRIKLPLMSKDERCG